MDPNGLIRVETLHVQRPLSSEPVDFLPQFLFQLEHPGTDLLFTLFFVAFQNILAGILDDLLHLLRRFLCFSGGYGACLGQLLLCGLCLFLSLFIQSLLFFFALFFLLKLLLFRRFFFRRLFF